MGDAALFALGTMVNGSPAMFERRRRILREARRMLEESGPGDFNIRDLCRRADVSSRTIYNAFGNREGVIALAIQDYFEAFHGSMPFAAAADTLDGAVDRQIVTTLRNLQIPHYLHAVTALYFSFSLDSRIRGVLLSIGERSWRPWLEAVRVRRGLEPAADIDRLAADLSDLQFAGMHRWGIGALDGRDVLDSTLLSVLTMVAGAARGETRTALRGLIADIASATPAWRARVAEAARRIERHWSRPADPAPA